MTGITSDAYRYAEGRCMDALISLRRLAGPAAIESLKAAIKVVEDERRRAAREERRQMERE